MRRRAWRLVVVGQALLALAVVGCYQGTVSKDPVVAAPVSQSTGLAAAPDQATPSDESPAEELVLPRGTRAVVLSVPMH